MPTIAPAPTATPTTGSEPTSEPAIDFTKDLEDFDPTHFDDPTHIDNEWLPLKPGTQWVYEGVTEEGGLTIPHRVIITVTDLTKVIAGVRTVVVWDQDYSADELVETELAFFAQDNDGAESSLEEVGAFQFKYYARGVGNIRVGWRGEDATQEELELVERVQLNPEALAKVRAEALALEEHAYEISEDVYGQTLPAEDL